MQQIYFDHTATTPLDEEVLQLFVKKAGEIYGNPSSSHALGRIARVEIEQARNQVAKLLGVNSTEIFFTSGATEAINMIIQGVASSKSPDRIIVSPLEHHAVLHTLEHLNHPIPVDFVNHNTAGEIDLNHMEQLLAGSKKPFVIMMAVNNEIGNINPISQVAQLCKKHNALFFSDMVQAVGKTDFSLEGVDFASFTAHKFNGPKGVGMAYISSKNKIQPLLHGGSQEQNMRAGTENCAAIAALAKALELSLSHFSENQKHISSLKQHLILKLKNHFPSVKFNGTSENGGVPNITSFTFPDCEAMEMLHIMLDMQGIYISQGSACSSGASHKSHVVTALQSGNEQAIRVSFGKQNTIQEVDCFVDILNNIVHK